MFETNAKVMKTITIHFLVLNATTAKVIIYEDDLKNTIAISRATPHPRELMDNQPDESDDVLKNTEGK